MMKYLLMGTCREFMLIWLDTSWRNFDVKIFFFNFLSAILGNLTLDMKYIKRLIVIYDFLGKEMIVCRTALDDFDAILALLGGPEEKRRAEELKLNVHVVDDQLSERSTKLQPQGKVKKRSKVNTLCYLAQFFVHLC